MNKKNPFKGYRFHKEIILQCVYWYCRYSLSYRDIEELMKERGIEVDHATLQRWVETFIPLLEEELKKRKKRVVKRWFLDETYIKVKGKQCYLYRAMDKQGKTIDCLLRKKRDSKAAEAFLKQAIQNNGAPIKINIDKSAANQSALLKIKEAREKAGQNRVPLHKGT